MAHANAQRGTHLGNLVTLTAQAAGTVTSPIFDTHQGLGLLVFINITARVGTPTLTVTLTGCIDDSATATYTILASTAIAATGLTVLRIYPGLTAAANATANDVIPGRCQISAVVGGTTSVTATISAYSLTAG
jgi:hypothetical protein